MTLELDSAHTLFVGEIICIPSLAVVTLAGEDNPAGNGYRAPMPSEG